MDNVEIADKFRTRVQNFNKSVSWDYYDRFCGLAIYLNETIIDGEDKEMYILGLEQMMVNSYKKRDGVVEKDGGEGQ